MNAEEMEQWLIKKGAVPISKKIKKEQWFKEVRKTPPCLKQSKIAEDSAHYKSKKGENTD